MAVAGGFIEKVLLAHVLPALVAIKKVAKQKKEASLLFFVANGTVPR